MIILDTIILIIAFGLHVYNFNNMEHTIMLISSAEIGLIAGSIIGKYNLIGKFLKRVK